ncbi:high affinity immunoglobulin gamma Fc receptor I-like isoform X1 [Brachyistius frenatus]|uniref:high affinity immunoglobulin gamma Fc receptor I-like isoform X1 n=1 Tax=Brachyistius frenatus TaxID=100188 RepID=UPI0037E76AE6
MDAVISLLVLSTLPQLIISQVPIVTTHRAAVNIVPQESRIFSGESLQLICSVPADTRTSWKYLWFKGSEKLPHSDRELSLWNTNVRDTGKFYCQGWRDTAVGNIYTMKSLPMEINVDGGFAILQVAPQPHLVGESLRMTCRLRGRAPLHEIVLYKDGIELMTQNGHVPQFYLTNLTVEDQGMYSCRASWDVNRRTHSVISVDTHVQILEVLTQPRLEIDDQSVTQHSVMKLICHLQYNARAPAPPIHYYFYRNSKKLGVATSENNYLARQTPGQYSCKARVPELNLLRQSELKMFGQKSEQQMLTPPHPHSRYQPPVAPRTSSLVRRQPPAAQPTAAQLTSAAPAVFQTAEKDNSPDSLVTRYQTL